MMFATTGRQWSTGAVLLAAMVSLVPVLARAQGSGTSCELPLTVPAAADVEIVLQSSQRGPGLLLTWPEPDDASSTCTALVDTANVEIPLALRGDYLDRVDRTLQFTFTTSGTVGDPARNRFVCVWNNSNTVRTGRIGGEVNLSNTGGLWVRDNGGTWTQRNAGLPRFLPYTNLVDLAVSGDGTTIVALSAGAQAQNDPRGIFRASAGGDWTAVAPDYFGTNRRIAFVAVDPTDSGHFAAGGRQNGLYVTTDDGATFTQWTSSLDPSFSPQPSAYEVTALLWTATRLYAAVRDFGLFISDDHGASFTRLANLRVPQAPDNPTLVLPVIRTVVEDPTDSDRVLVGLVDHGVWESTDAGATWHTISATWVPDPNNWRRSALSLAVDPAAPARLFVGTVAQGIWRTLDGGGTWQQATTPFDGYTVKPEVQDVVLHGGALLALANPINVNDVNLGLLESTDAGLTWTTVANQPYNRFGRRLVSTPGGLLRPTVGGGIYLPDTWVNISGTTTVSATDPAYRTLEFGIELRFGNGQVILVDANGDGSPDPLQFSVVCQDYQGWIVWRSDRDDPDDMVMIGRYDKNNPESCIEGFCGDDNFVILPNCFSERRAACFDFDTPGYASFYDDGIYNGFTYYYAVTPFDYGDISLVVDPLSLASPMVFPARYPDDPQAEGPGNRQAYQVNVDAAAAVDGDEIYVYPNPLRLGAGIAGGEGEEVVWTNLPPDSRIQVYTLAGDRIADLPQPDSPQQGGNIYWVTRNDDHRLLASGIYIWRVLMPERGDFWGKLVIIR